MTEAAAVMAGIAVVAALADWVAVARGWHRLELVAKPATMLALIGVAATVDPAHTGRRGWFVAAGVLSLAGDVFLMLPRERFVAGVAAFLGAHLAYIAGLAQGTVSGARALAAVLLMAAVVGLLARPLLGSIRERHRELVVPIAVYMVVISVMVVMAISVGPALAAGGALLFAASDATLAWDRFVRPLRGGAVAVMVTYHLGQAGLLLSLVQR